MTSLDYPMKQRALCSFDKTKQNGVLFERGERTRQSLEEIQGYKRTYRHNFGGFG